MKTFLRTRLGRKHLTAIARMLEEDPLRLDLQLTDGAEAIDESALTPILNATDAATLRSRKPLSEDPWKEVLRYIGDALGQKSLEGSLAHAAAHLHEHFTTQLIETLKSMGAESDPPWFALVLRFLSDTHAEVKANGAALAKLQRSFDAHQKDVREAFEMLNKSIASRTAVCADGTEDDLERLKTDRDQLVYIQEQATALELLLEGEAALQGKIDGLSKQISGVSAQVTGLSTQLADHATESAAAHARTHRLLEKYVPPPAPPAKSNFASLGIVTNAGFVQCERELARLRQVMTDGASAGGGSAALTQGFTGEGGIGNSQLAQRYPEKLCAELSSPW